MKKIGFGFAILVGLVLLFAGYVLIAGNKKFDAPYPDIKASTDSSIIARGEYLVFGPAHCATCHVPVSQIMEVEATGIKVPLIGGWEVDIPPVLMRAPNITPDMETGIGKLTDAEIARSLRYAIGHEGQFILPVMPYAQMSDADLQAIISYLRAQPPVYNKVEKTQYKFLGKALLSLGVLKPKPLEEKPPASVTMDDEIAYGKYLATGVANCMGCHTQIDLMSGEFMVPPFAGGFYFEADAMTEGYSYVSPNLTPDPETGIMASWSEEFFLKRFKSGRVHKTSPMPWGALSRMDTTEIVAIYRYLKTLDPIHNPIGQTVFEPGEQPEQ